MQTAAKQLHFPLLGVQADKGHHDVETREGHVYSAPFAMNVRGRDAIERRVRGGSRPGMKAVVGVKSSGGGVWTWANGEKILWPDGAEVTFSTGDAVFAPDGTRVIDAHSRPNVAASVGDAPQGAEIATFYRARVFAAVGADWFCSRIGDAADWDYGADRDDVARACAGNVALAGVKGEGITAFMPVHDSYLYVATARSLWCISGDPVGGSMSCISQEVGVAGANAWCWTGRRLYFLSPTGLYSVTPGEHPVLVSDALPDLRGTSASFMGYDPEEDALHVFTTKGDWFVELDGQNAAFWPVSFQTGKRPTNACRMMVSGVDKAAFLCADGAWRVYDDATACECASKVAIGPFRVSASDDADGFLAEIHFATGISSSNVSATIYTGHSAEAAEHAAANGTGGASGVFSSDWNAVWRPRIRGAWAVVVLECAASGKWAFEALRAVSRLTGRLRP